MRTNLRRDRAIRAVLLLAFAVLVCLRMPEIILKGRFWAEEGAYFFDNAWVMPPVQALFNPFGGYLNIVANAATLAARWLMPLRLAPYLTIAVGLLFQLCPPFLILTARDPWLRPIGARALGCALLLVVPASEEVWLQTLHSQFQLTLCCAMILALDATPGWLARVRCAMLFLAPLCGPGAFAVLPLLLVRAALERSRVRLVQVIALAAGAVIQLSLFFHALPGRAYRLDPAGLLGIFTVRHLSVPFLGAVFSDRLSASIRSQLAAGHLPLEAIIPPILVFASFGVAILASHRSRPALWLLAGGLLVAAISYFGALGPPAELIDPRVDERYAYVPQALFGLAAFALAMTASGWIARVAFLVVAWLIVAGAIAFTEPWSMISDGPSWRREIAIWRADHAHTIRIWPQGWIVVLKGTSAR
jgi:hypothetical protein